LERLSWRNYIKTKYPSDKPKFESLYDIKQRFDELARQSEGTIAGEPRHESIRNEISELQIRLQKIREDIPK